MSDPVLIISTSVDSSTDVVFDVLKSKSVPVVRINTEEYPFNTGVTFEASVQDGASFKVQSNLKFRSIWYRRVRIPSRPQTMDTGHYDFSLKEGKFALIGSLLALSRTIPTMSRPDAVWSAEHKPFQLAIAQSCGLQIPHTFISNDPVSVIDAYNLFSEQMIAKPVRTGYVEVATIPKAIYTSQIKKKDMEQIHRISVSPAIFQPLIQKRADIRVTIVGNKLFAAEIDSQSDKSASIDWRKTSNPDLPHEEHRLPSEIKEKLFNLMKKLNLNYGAIDLILNPQGEYIFLEINPSGQWLWLDRILGFDISNSIADWLANGGTT